MVPASLMLKVFEKHVGGTPRIAAHSMNIFLSLHIGHAFFSCVLVCFCFDWVSLDLSWTGPRDYIFCWRLKACALLPILRCTDGPNKYQNEKSAIPPGAP